MTYRYYGWMRRTSKERWYQMVESNDYQTCWESLLAVAQERFLSQAGSLVVLPANTVPAKPLPRRKR